MMLKIECREGNVLYDKIEKITYNPAVVNVAHRGENNSDPVIGPNIYRAHIERNSDGELIVCGEDTIAEIKSLDRLAWPKDTGFLKDSSILRLFIIDIKFSDHREFSRIATVIGGNLKFRSESAKAFIMNDDGKTVEILRNYWF